MAAFQQTAIYRSFKDQLTPRVISGLAVLGLILAVMALSNLAILVTDRSARLREIDRNLALQNSLSQDVDWVAQAARTRDVLEQTENRFWRGSTSGIVGAQLQEVVERAAETAGLTRIRVRVLPEPEPVTGRTSMFEISVTAQDRAGQFLSFMQIISRSEYALIPRTLDWARANGTIGITLQAPAIIGDATASAEPET